MSTTRPWTPAMAATGLADVDALEKPFRPGPWLEGRAGSALYLNRALMTYTRSQHLEGRVPPDPSSRRGRFDGTVVLNDLAPTLATLLGIETPSGASGRALDEILDPRGVFPARPGARLGGRP